MPRAGQCPYFHFYPNDFSSDRNVEAMTAEEVGAYILLICKSWSEEPVASIPDDDRILSRWARMSPERWSACRASVLAAFKLGKDGRWHQKRLRLEYDKLRRIQKNRSESGKLGAEKRHGKSRIDNTLDGSAIAAPKQRQDFAIASPSHTSINKCSEVDVPFSLCSVEEKIPEEKKKSQLEVRIDELAREMCLRHPKRRSCGPAEARKLLSRIVQRFPAAERLSILSQVDENHAAWCNSPEWKKDNGEYAKALANWLAPTEERYRVAPKSDDDEVYYSYARGF